jgi:hypothetical protein
MSQPFTPQNQMQQYGMYAAEITEIIVIRYFLEEKETETGVQENI